VSTTGGADVSNLLELAHNLGMGGRHGMTSTGGCPQASADMHWNGPVIHTSP